MAEIFEYDELKMYFGEPFYINDKIICSKNTPTVKNGDMGIITNISPNSITAMFDTGEESFDSDKAVELGISLAYCISVHKAQGSGAMCSWLKRLGSNTSKYNNIYNKELGNS